MRILLVWGSLSTPPFFSFSFFSNFSVLWLFTSFFGFILFASFLWRVFGVFSNFRSYFHEKFSFGTGNEKFLLIWGLKWIVVYFSKGFGVF